jgi:predicted nucleotidyltransferase
MREILKFDIVEKLTAIAEEQGVCILFACESGSRGWQFPSPDSDYDIRFIYALPMNSYLSIARRDEQIGFPINERMDIFGWDIRKVLRLIWKSNTTPFEWLQSPVVYMQQTGFREELWALCGQYFDPRSNIHHYLGIARTALETASGNNVITIKKLFYVLRPILAAKWCKEKNSIAPMSIYSLMCLMPENLQQITESLIAYKLEAPEGHLITIEPELKQYIDYEFEACMQASAEMPKTSFNVEPLDVFFRKISKKVQD